ncbi:MAG TPA: CrcB family protein [Wenzhouxiangellaceae bacterium]|nr:CrcB family protein [Wenzhouxiangellaceae bacterium]
MNRAALYAAIALAAALGGCLRHGVSIVWLHSAGNGWTGCDWPWPTLIVNVLGSLLIAAYWRLAGPGGRFEVSLQRRTAVMTGFFGGLTTFSMFGIETLQLLENGRWSGAVAYLVLTGIGALGAAWLALRGKPRAMQR